MKNLKKQLTQADTVRSSAAEYLTFLAATSKQSSAIEIRHEDVKSWLTQKMIGTVYDVEVNTVSYHLKQVFADEELSEDSVIRSYRITAGDDKRCNTKHYPLQVIGRVGLNVDNNSAVQSRKRANQIVQDRLYSSDFDRLLVGESVEMRQEGGQR